jgi:hypothetical protein
MSKFHAFVDGTNGDVTLERVSAAFLKTRVEAKGEIAETSGTHGKTATVDLTVADGKIQDVLRLFVREPKPPLNGVTEFRAHVVVPPGNERFLQKVRLSGVLASQKAGLRSLRRKRLLATSASEPAAKSRRIRTRQTKNA